MSPTSTKKEIIRVEKVSKVYTMGNHRVHALKDISLVIHENEFVSIMGQSGSGKSTLMNLLGCLDSVSKGRYYLDGINVNQYKGNDLAEIRNKKIGFIFQSFNLLPRLTSLQNVALPMQYAGAKKRERNEAATKALESVGLGSRVNHKPNELSGGQRQRVAIARALINQPALLLADEPTGNLDSRSGEEIMTIFQELNNAGVTIVMVTHEPEIAAFTKRKVIFRDGEILEDKPVEDRRFVDLTAKKTTESKKTNLTRNDLDPLQSKEA